ncbi:MAG: efflux RND transporter permease subunit [Firmicutes bacterium]|nr:efflux RND transporter permease subunit [Bacillota bacterium]
MKIVDFAVKRPVTMIILVAVVIILGFFTLSRMVVDLYPEMKLPVAAVIATYEGAGPEEVESRVSKLLEGAANTVGGVKTVSSTSSAGSSLVIVSFDWGTDMDKALIDIREKIGIVEAALPDGVDKPMVLKMDPNMMPIMQIGISGSDQISLAQLQSIAEDKIKSRLERIPEVASVTITGGLQREVKVEVDPVKLQAYGLTLGQVNQVLQTENFNASSGTVNQDQRQYFVRSLQQFESLDDIQEVAIFTTSGNTVYLRDIATIIDGYKDNAQLTRVDQGSAVGIHLMKQSGANTVAACDAIRAELAQVQKELDVDLNIKIVMDQSTFIKQSLTSTQTTMWEGALLAMLVLFLFLRNIRSTFIVFTAIPLSIVATFILMYFNGSTLNLITLGGLALGVGRMVDDSIVVFENIYRHRSLGLPPLQAALTGASEVGSAVIAATVTIIAVFMPILFVQGLAAVIFKPMAITISFAIFCSLMVSLTIVPLMASRMLTDSSMAKRDSGTNRAAMFSKKFGIWIDNLGERYTKVVVWSLGHRKTISIFTTILLLASVAAYPLIGAEFLPRTDSGEIAIAIETDKGSRLANTDAIVRQVESRLHEIPEVNTIFSSVGSSANMFLASGTKSDQAAISVKLVNKNQRSKSVDTIAEEIRTQGADIAGAKIQVSVTDQTSGSMLGGGAQVNVQLKGDDLTVLRDLSDQITAIVRSVPGTREVTSSLADGQPEMQIKVDRQRAATFGLTPMQIAAEIKNAMQGTVATRYRVEGTEVDVRVGYIPENHQDLEYLQNLTLRNNTGAVVKLSQLASFELTQGPVAINRIDQVRVADITANLLNRDLQSVTTDIQTLVAGTSLPVGYTVEYTGANQDMVESFSSLLIALLLAIILVYAVMAIQYESFFNPFIIMFSVPTAFIGIVLGLLLTGRAFSVPAFIGIIMLVGIVVSNAIVMVDYLERLRRRGMERNAAIIEAGRVRLRPILMTAFATILAMLPLALGLGEGAESMAPLATVVIGGLIVSTFITLLLIPVVYTVFDDWLEKARRRFLGVKPPEPIEPEVG